MRGTAIQDKYFSLQSGERVPNIIEGETIEAAEIAHCPARRHPALN